MRHKDVSTIVRLAALVAATTWGAFGCSSANEDDEPMAPTEGGEENAAEGSENAASNEAEGTENAAANEAEAPAAEDTAAADTASVPADDTAAADTTTEPAGNAAAPVDTASAGMPASGPAAVASIPAGSAPAAAASAAPAAASGRVVRYVNVTSLDIHGQPSDSAPAVGKILKGEIVMVLEENGWGRISDEMFVKLDQLSSKAVPRDRAPAVWQAPAH